MALFLRAHERRKDGKTHTCRSLVENRRCTSGRVVQRHVPYLGALSAAQELRWEKTVQQFDPPPQPGEPLPGLTSPRELQAKEAAALAVHLNQFRIERPRQWGACWIALMLWQRLKLSEFWSQRLPPSREALAAVVSPRRSLFAADQSDRNRSESPVGILSAIGGDRSSLRRDVQTTTLGTTNAWDNLGEPVPTNLMRVPLEPGDLFLRVRGQ